MVGKVPNILYFIFAWLIFPVIFTIPLLFYPPIGNIIDIPAALLPKTPSVAGISFQNFLIYAYVAGAIFVSILHLFFKFTIKNKLARFLILVALILLSWLTWNPKDHVW